MRFSLRKKMFRMMLLVAVAMFVFAVLSILVVLYQSGLALYNEKITNLRTRASLMEQQLKVMEDISFQIFSDDNFQHALIQIKDHTVSDRYQMNKLKALIVETVMPYLTQTNSIIGFTVYDSEDRPLAAYQMENGALLPPDDQASKYIFPSDGTPAWSADIPYLVLSRSIRRIENLALDVIGKVCLYIDVSVFQNELQYQAADKTLYVLDNEKNTINRNMPQWLSAFDFSTGSKLLHYAHQGKYFLIFQHHSETTSMTYIDVMDVTRHVVQTILLLIIPCSLLLLIVLAIVMISSRWSLRILRPFYALIDDISTSDHWDPSHFRQEHRNFQDGDDLSTLNAHILRMLHHIDTLNKKDYQNQRALDLSQYQALQAQIKPHFLYNALDMMNWVAKKNKQTQLVSMLEALADYMRYITDFQETIIPIEKELDAIQKYISIEKNRFEDMLRVTYNVSLEVSGVVIPKMTIQPLVENSIKHRQMKKIQPCEIQINVLHTGDSVLVSVEDNGPGFDPAILHAVESAEGIQSGGIGLRNISKRLIQAFGEQAALLIESPTMGNYGARVSFYVPVSGEGVIEHENTDC